MTTAVFDAHLPSTPISQLTLDELLSLSAEELDLLYENASVPRIEDVRGDLRGRMLAVVDEPKILIGLTRALASTSWFPWRGKSFQPRNETGGTGVNRIFSDRLRLFTFNTSIGPSHAGPFDALHINYDHDGNPGIIRRIEDEIRELRPGLWLGQAYLRTRRNSRLVLYFGLTLD